MPEVIPVTQDPIHADDCNGALEICMDVFVTTKAFVLTFLCISGILWFRNKKFNSFPVMCTLVASIAIVSENLLYSRSDINLQLRS